MEKETLLAGFNERLGNPDANGMYEAGVSSRTLDAYVNGILPTITDDAQVDDAFWSRHTDFIKSMGGQMRHEKAEFVKNYKPKPAVVEKPVEKPGLGNGTENPEIAELKKRMEAMERENAEEKRRMAAKGLRMEAKGKYAELNVANKALWGDAVEMAECKDGMTVDELVKSAKSIYEKKLKEYFGDGATPYGSDESSPALGKEEADARREAFRKRMQSQGRLPKTTKD